MIAKEFNARAMRKLAAKNKYVPTEEVWFNTKAQIKEAAEAGKRFVRPFTYWEAREDLRLQTAEPETLEEVVKTLQKNGFTVKVRKHLISRKPDYFNAIVRW